MPLTCSVWIKTMYSVKYLNVIVIKCSEYWHTSAKLLNNFGISCFDIDQNWEPSRSQLFICVRNAYVRISNYCVVSNNTYQLGVSNLIHNCANDYCTVHCVVRLNYGYLLAEANDGVSLSQVTTPVQPIVWYGTGSILLLYMYTQWNYILVSISLPHWQAPDYKISRLISMHHCWMTTST